MNCKLLILAAAAVALFTGSLAAQDVLTVTAPASSFAGATYSSGVSVDSNDPLEGWSYGVCNDTAFTTFVGPITNGPLIDAMDDGDGPGFIETSMAPDGYTVGVVVCITGCETLAAGVGSLLTEGTYSADAETPGTNIAICSTLGLPPVASVLVVNGLSITPAFVSATLEILGVPDPMFTYIAPNAATVNYAAPGGIGGVSVDASFSVSETDNSGLGAPFPNQTQGFSAACSNDPSLVTPVSVAAIGPLAMLDGGDGPEFFEVGLFADAWSVGVVYIITGGETIGFSDAGDAVLSVQYDGVAGALMGVVGTTSTPLSWNAGVGTPPVALVVVVDGGSHAAGLSDGSLSFNGTTTIPFERGDCNGDDMINIADIVSLLSQLFNGVPIVCSISLDVDGNGSADIGDAIYLAAYIFQGGPPPPAPFGDCADVPGQTPEDCENAACIPGPQ